MIRAIIPLNFVKESCFLVALPDTNSKILSWLAVTSDASNIKQQLYQKDHVCLEMHFYCNFVRLFLKRQLVMQSEKTEAQELTT